MLEIGTTHGGTRYVCCQAVIPDATLVSVGLPDGSFGGSYLTCRTPLFQAFIRPRQMLHLLRDDSPAESTLAKVAALFGGQPIDFAIH